MKHAEVNLLSAAKNEAPVTEHRKRSEEGQSRILDILGQSRILERGWSKRARRRPGVLKLLSYLELLLLASVLSLKTY